MPQLSKSNSSPFALEIEFSEINILNPIILDRMFYNLKI